MADRKHPKTHVEDQDLDKPRKQPLSPQHEGIDPLTESDTMYPAENVKSGQAGEKAEDQEPHTDKGNTSPANRTTRSRK